MRTRCYGTSFLFLLIFATTGCTRYSAPPFDIVPPIATLVVTGPSGTEVWGQGVWVGNHILTAAHLFEEEGVWHVPDSLLVNTKRVSIQGYVAGSYIPPENWTPTDSMAWFSEEMNIPVGNIDDINILEEVEDWVFLQIDSRSSVIPKIVPHYGLVHPREKLYAIGVDPTAYGGKVSAIPLTVVAGYVVDNGAGTRKPIPDRLISTYAPTRRRKNMAGWSGSLVGRYSWTDKRWEYVGNLVSVVPASKTTRSKHVLRIVVRPPPEIVAKLFSENE